MKLTYKQADLKKTYSRLFMSTPIKNNLSDDTFANWIFSMVVAHTNTYKFEINNHAVAWYPVPDQFISLIGDRIVINQDKDGTINIV